MDPKLIDPIKTKEQAFTASTFGFASIEPLRQLTTVMPATETIYDLQVRCAVMVGGVRREVLGVLQGPYDARPYLPPRPGPPMRYFAVSTVKDLNYKSAAPLTLTFEGRLRRVRGDSRSAVYVPLHKAQDLSADLLKTALSAPLGEEGEAEGQETRWLVWGCNRETGHLSWVMLVIEERALLALVPQHHNDTVERYARLRSEDLDAKVLEQPPEKRRQVYKKILSIYARHLQIQMQPK